MQTELEKIKEGVMEKIHDGKVKMKPRWWFLAGSVLTFIGLVLSIVTSVFFIGLLRFALRSHGMMREYRIGQMVINFPWWTLIFAVLTLILGIWLIKKYDFSYKINPWHIIAGLILAVLIAGWAIDAIGINDTLSKRGPMQGIMRGYMKDKNIPPPQLFRR